MKEGKRDGEERGGAGPAKPIGQVGHLPYHFFPRLR